MRTKRRSMPRRMTGPLPARALALCLLAGLSVGCWSARETVSGILGGPARDVRVDLHSYKVLEDGRNRVYHTDASTPLAHRVLHTINQQEAFLEQTLGLQSCEGFGVVIIHPNEEDARYHVSPPRGWWVWSFAPADPTALTTAAEFDEIDQTLLHERTETAVTRALHVKQGLYDVNPQSRWIGDGLADWVAYRYCLRSSPIAAANALAGYHDSVKRLRERWYIRHVDLREFRAMIGSPDEVKQQVDALKRYGDVPVANYAMSFTYWASLEKEKGPAAVREIVTKLCTLQQPTNGNIDRVIRETAGEHFVARVCEFDTAAAQVFIDAEIVALIPRLRRELRSADHGTRNAARDVLARLSKGDFASVLGDMPTTARVVDVIPGSPAHAAGLRSGMVMETVDARAVESYDAFIARVKAETPGPVSLLVSERGAEKTLRVDSFAGCRFESVPK